MNVTKYFAEKLLKGQVAAITGARLDCDGGQNLLGSALINHSIIKMFSHSNNI